MKMMRQTHIKIQTYRSNEPVTNEFLCKTVLWPMTMYPQIIRHTIVRQEMMQIMVVQECSISTTIKVNGMGKGKIRYPLLPNPLTDRYQNLYMWLRRGLGGYQPSRCKILSRSDHEGFRSRVICLLVSFVFLGYSETPRRISTENTPKDAVPCKDMPLGYAFMVSKPKLQMSISLSQRPDFDGT